jgi:hypothetical protein
VRRVESVAPVFHLRHVMMSVLWPSFLMACVTSGLVFSLVSPEQLMLLDTRIHLSSIGIYTIGFFVFWLVGAIASSLTALLFVEAH